MEFKLSLISKKDEMPAGDDVATLSFAPVGYDEMVRTESGREVVLGIGSEKDKKINIRKLRILVRKAVRMAKSSDVKRLVVSIGSLPKLSEKISPKGLSELVVLNAYLANYEFIDYKTAPTDGWKFLEELCLVTSTKEERDGAELGALEGVEVNLSRNLINTPPIDLNPEGLAEYAKNLVKDLKVTVKVLDKDELKKIKAGGILAVGSGSSSDPRLIVLEYNGGKKSEAPVVFVGKAVTFDSGGINLKPSEAIYEMHMDMSGGSAAIHAVALAARLGLKRNLVAIVPSVENMPSGVSYRPGDIVKTMDGTFVEILNTDAEGRVILADALTYAKSYKPKLVLDVATLTGAAHVALGNWASAIFTDSARVEKLLREKGEESGEYVWPLPLWDEYGEEIKSSFADIGNIGNAGRYGGAMHGAKFLQHFAKDYTWAHIDIAPRMTPAASEQLAKGALGPGLLLLIKVAEAMR